MCALVFKYKLHVEARSTESALRIVSAASWIILENAEKPDASHRCIYSMRARS